MIFEGDLSPQQVLEQVGGYHAMLPDTETIEHDGKVIPLREHPEIKEKGKDLATLARNAIAAQQEIGRRERVPGKDAKPEEMAAFKSKLIERGILPAPVASPKDYEIVRPQSVPDALWNPELADSLASILHKHGIPKEAAPELLALHEQAITGATTILKTSEEQGMAALKAEHGDKFDERFELAKRFAPMIFKMPEEVAFAEATGLANSPLYLGPIMRLAQYAQQDSSFMQELSRPAGGAMALEEAKAEHTRVMTDPKHEWHDAWKRGDRKALDYVADLYNRATQNGAGATV